MARITDITTAWSTGVTLSENEFWQCHEGYVAVSTSATPGDADGIRISEGFGVDIAAGKTVRYKKLNGEDAIISREEL